MEQLRDQYLGAGPYLVSVLRYSEILVENRDVFTPLAFYAPLGGPRRNITKTFGIAKTRMVRLLDDEKSLMTAV